MLITHLGHACLLVETPRTRILIDPGSMSSFEGVRDLDAVLVTHQHADHVDITRLGALLACNRTAQLVVDPDSVEVVSALAPDHIIARPGDRLSISGSTVGVVGGKHATVYGQFPTCTNVGYLINDGELFHPGDSFTVPETEVDVLGVAIDAPWLKIAESIDYVRSVAPRAAVPIHEGETRDPDKYTKFLDNFGLAGVVVRLEPGSPLKI